MPKERGQTASVVVVNDALGARVPAAPASASAPAGRGGGAAAFSRGGSTAPPPPPLAAAPGAAAPSAAALSATAASASSAKERVLDPADEGDDLSAKGCMTELSSARGAFGLFSVLWRYATLNVLVESVQEPCEDGDISALMNVYNLIALIEALLLGVGMSPFMDIARITAAYPDDALTRFNCVMIILMMAFALANLCLIVMLSFYMCVPRRRDADGMPPPTATH